MRTVLVLFGLLFFSLPASGEVDPRCPLKGVWPTQAELDTILRNHKEWISKIGNKTILSEEERNDPLRANLCKTNLWYRDLSDADLSYARLSDANFTDVSLIETNLTGASLFGANLAEAYLSETNLTGASLDGANLSNASLYGADLSYASLRNANLTGADLHGTNLTEAVMFRANLTNASLRLTNVTKTSFFQSTFINTIYEPSSEGIPRIDIIDLNKLLTSKYNAPRGFVALRTAYLNSGKKTEAKKITRLLNQRETTKLITPEGKEKSVSIFNRIEWAFKVVFFDWPTDWGFRPGRALKILLIGIALFMMFYLVALQAPEAKAGIWRMRAKERLLDKDKNDEELVTPDGFWSALPTAFYFSVLSAFHFGWKDLNVGSWIHRIQHKEYTFRATGWVRTVAGIQSLMSVYLVAMWALTYFGRPFD